MPGAAHPHLKLTLPHAVYRLAAQPSLQKHEVLAELEGWVHALKSCGARSVDLDERKDEVFEGRSGFLHKGWKTYVVNPVVHNVEVTFLAYLKTFIVTSFQPPFLPQWLERPVLSLGEATADQLVFLLEDYTKRRFLQA